MFEVTRGSTSSKGGRLTAVLDPALAYLGDPMADLGALFCHEVDPRIVLYHAIRFALQTPVATILSISKSGFAPEYVQLLAWYPVYARTPLEQIDHLEGMSA